MTVKTVEQIVPKINIFRNLDFVDHTVGPKADLDFVGFLKPNQKKDELEYPISRDRAVVLLQWRMLEHAPVKSSLSVEQQMTDRSSDSPRWKLKIKLK